MPVQVPRQGAASRRLPHHGGAGRISSRALLALASVSIATEYAASRTGAGHA